MAFIKTNDGWGCFDSEAVTNFTVHSILEINPQGNVYVTFTKVYSSNTQIGQFTWSGEHPLTYENVGGAIKRAGRSSKSVVAIDDLIEEELSLTPKLSAVL